MKSRPIRLALWITLLLVLAAGGGPAAAQSGATYFITDVNADAFPTVSFRLRAVDLNNRVVSGINSGNLAVYENGGQAPAGGVEVTPHDDGPITFLFLIDQGRLANYSSFGLQNIRQALGAISSSGVFANGRDQLEVMVRENINSDRTEPRLPPTQQVADLTTWLSNYPFERRSQNNTKGLEGVADAIAEMGRLVPVPGSQTAVIVFVTRAIEDPASSVAVVAAQNQANAAKSAFISVYPLSTQSGGFNKEPLEILAEISNGRYTALQSRTAGSLAEDVFREINTQRQYYTVSYQSALGDPGPRVITLNGRDVPAVGATGHYEVSPQAATATIVEPASGAVISREALLNADGEPVYSPSSLKVVVELSFPDGFPRSVGSAEILVNGVSQGTTTPSGEAARAELSVDLTEVTTEGSNPLTLEVRVVDSLGLEASAQTSVVVDVATPPGKTSPLAIGAVVVGALLCLVVVVVATLGSGLFALRGRGGQQQASPVGRALSAGPLHTLLGGRALRDKVLATLTVLEGPKGLIGEAINVVKPTTVIGRHPQTTDVTFYPEEESSVSRVHCTLQKDGEMFKLTDNGSSAGTRLNGRSIPANDPVVLADGDEIVLGDLGRRGVKMRFNTIADAGEVKFSGSADDRTRIMDEPAPDEDHFSSYDG